MNLIRLSIERPMAIVAMVLMIILFGYVALQRIPIQMAPDVRQPVLIVTTSWRGAAPAEVEREIVIPQEDELKRLEGVQRVLSEASHGRGKITLEFSPGVNFDRMLLLVSNRLDRVNTYPEEAEEPTLGTSGTEDNAIAWFVFSRAEGNDTPMLEYGDFLRDVVQERLERVPGVGGVNIFGETEREMQIVIDPERLAQYRLTVGQVIARLRAANASITGGDIDEGKRRYTVRTEGDFATRSEVEAVVLRSNARGAGLGRVTVGDIATVTLAYKEARARMSSNGVPALALNLTREQGANVIETMRLAQETMARLRDGPIKEAGLKVRQVYDETDYINSSIALVMQNIYFGGVLAIVILLLFLRSWRPTVVVAFAIPVSVVGSFVAMALLGRSLNVISLAGIAFAVGMVVDAAIVVLENIYRLRQGGMSRTEAAYHGTAQVWPAVLVSALTTVMVFIPILIMDLEVGQLFRDIAVAISVSVLLSLLVSVTLIPALSNRVLAGRVPTLNAMPRILGIDWLARGFGSFWRYFARVVVRSKVLALLVVAAITAAATVFAIAFLPKLDYLPIGNRNFVIGFVLPPAGYNLDTTEAIARGVQEKTKMHWSDAALAESGGTHPPGTADAQKMIDRFFFVALRGRAFIAARHVDDQKAPELIPILQTPAREEPGTFGFVFQPSLFGRSIGSGRSIDIDISGPDLETIFATGRQVFFRTMGALSPRDGHRTRPRPALTLGEPEVRVLPDRVKLADNGLSARDLAQAVDAFNDGVRIAEINVDGKRIDLTLKGPAREQESTQSIGVLPVVTTDGRILPVQSLSEVGVTAGPTQIRRIDRVRTVTMSVSPARVMPLQAAMDKVRSDVIEPLRESGLPEGVHIRMSGSADKLTLTWNEIVLDLALAVIIVYLVMAVLFESFVYPLIVLLSVPIAAAGGLAGLSALNTYVNQPLDMLTMLGFVILVGIVVNNAILLVHQTLHHIRREGMTAGDAIEAATENRIRPIFMSTLTSVFGMLPLVVFPGAGSELYRGLGSVVLGGLSLSAVLTMAVVPPMMSITVGIIERRAGKKARVARADVAPAE
ncbi:MAG: efflux RND transporter permease subunit [Defluviicoccus sp.]|nr:efflux RND transporter permease subunit [Defluviicoccus sp.]MDE0382711.1 efflux RND transporter permease subunit [Defluviicoccus sp.]